MLVLLMLVLSAVCAVIPMLGFLLLIWWLDRYDREPFAVVALTFLWGACGGVVLSLIGSTALLVPITMLFGEAVADPVGTVFIAPLVEEPAKAVVLLLLVGSRHFDNTTDGFVYGAAAGLGFGMTENFLYFAGVAATGDPGAWFATVLIRTLYSALMHAGATSMVGAAFGFSKYRGWGARAVALPLGLAAAMGIHALWNGLITAEALADAGGALTALNLLLFPAEFFVLFVVLQVCLWDERVTIRRELTAEAAAGVLPAAHVPHLSSYLKRGRRAWVPKGVPHHAYVRAATMLAFRRWQGRQRGPESRQARTAQRLREELRVMLNAP